MTNKTIILYKTRPAIIISSSDGKFEIETENGIKKVREKDFIVLAENNSESLKAIISAECPEPDFSDLREFFECGTANFFEIVELAWSDLKAHELWSAWKTICASNLFIAESPDQPIKIRSEEEVNEILKKQEEKESAEKERDEFINSFTKCVKQNSDEEFDLKKYSHFLQELEAYALEKTNKSKVLKDAHLKENIETAHRALIKTGFWKQEKNPYPTRAGIPLNTSKMKLPEPNFDFDFLDLTNITAYAIDSAESTDPDDAICFDGEHLWIHVANPGDTITPDSKADLDARSRGSTLYIPEGISRMLGEEAVTNFALGLTPTSHALSFKLKLDEYAQIVSVDVLRTLVKVKCITYIDADKEKENPDLKALFEIADKNRQKREDAGAVEIKMPKVKITVKNEDDTQKVYIDEFEKTESFLMVKEMMLLAGEAAARFAFKNNIPFQFISQEAPGLPKKLPQGLAGEYRKRKSMRPRSVGTIPAMHSALGISMYSQVTSPLRRYGDLIAHQQLLKFIDGKELMLTDDLLMRIGAGDIAARNCGLADRNSKQHWKLIYLLQNPEWTGEAVVLESLKKSVRICIPSLAYETEVNLGKELSINEVIKVKAENIDIAKLTVRFALV